MSELENIKNNRELLSSFVNAVTDMETRIFVLNESAGRCRQDAQNRENESCQKKNAAEMELEKCKHNYSEQADLVESINTYHKYRKRTRKFDTLWNEIILFYMIYTVVSVVTTWLGAPALGRLLFGPDHHGFNIFMILIPAIWLGVCYAVFTSIKKHEYAKILSKHQLKLNKKEQALQRAQNVVDAADRDCIESHAVAQRLNKRAEELEASAGEVQKNLMKCYDLAIIPPAYRNFVCMALINDIFINDKADTMREAVILCDAEIRHRQLISQLNNIYYALQMLSVNMLSMNYLLQNISHDISLIHGSISNISTQQERIAYATESIKKSADNVDFYIYQRRTGSL